MLTVLQLSGHHILEALKYEPAHQGEERHDKCPGKHPAVAKARGGADH